MSYDPHEPVSAMLHIPIEEVGESMVDVLALSDRIFFDRPRFDYKRESLLREGVAHRLAQAASNLPEGYSFGLIEGWRPPFIQRRMFRAVWNQMSERYPELDENALRDVVEKYSAPMDDTVPPPHTTGGAFDLALYRGDVQCEVCAPFNWLDPACWALDAEGLSDESQENRAILKAAFAGTGITNYPSEYWHWSYGDQGWAYRGGHKSALYAAIEPEGWSPEPRDMIDGPLVFLPDAVA